MAIITKNTLESNSYANIISFLDNRTIISDPRDPQGYLKRKFVYDYDPLAKAMDFGELPYIVAEYPLIESENTSTDGKVKTIVWRMNLTVRVARDGSNGATTGRNDLLGIGDDLFSLFNEIQYRDQFAALRMYFMKLTKTGTSTPTIDQRYLLQSDYEIMFTERIKISD